MNIENCIYRFINNEDEIIYIGKAKNLIKRLNGHNHLPKECYEERKRIEFISFETEEEMNIAERYFIAKIKPKYNIEFSKNDINFRIESLDSVLWKRYDLKEIKKEKSIKEKAKFTTIANSVDKDIQDMILSIKSLNKEWLKLDRETNEAVLMKNIINKKEAELESIKQDKIEKLLFINDLNCDDWDMKKTYIKYYTIEPEEIKIKVMKEIKEEEFEKVYDEVKRNRYYSRVDLYERIGMKFIGAGSQYSKFYYPNKWKEFIKDKQEASKMQIKIIREIEYELENIWGKFYDDILYYEHQNYSPQKIKNCKMVRRLKQNI